MVALSSDPRTPILGCQIPSGLLGQYCGNDVSLHSFLSKRSYSLDAHILLGFQLMPIRMNWVVESSGVDYLHLLISSMAHLIKSYAIDARLMFTMHEEIRYLASENDRYRTAMALQISNLWAGTMVAHRLGFQNLPLVSRSCLIFIQIRKVIINHWLYTSGCSLLFSSRYRSLPSKGSHRFIYSSE
jgi:DNA polymerase gamma 1